MNFQHPEMPNRVAGGFSPPAPTAPQMRVRMGRFLNEVYSKPVFWSDTYFLASCGGVTIEQLKSYVEQQHSLDD